MKNEFYDIEGIIKKIEKYNYVSFDIFDTLIKRNVNKPSDIFKLTAIEYEKESNIKIPDFNKLRIEAEIRAKEKTKEKEPNIDDIYNNLDIDKVSLNRLKQIEINLEIKFCQQNKKFYPVYEYCVKKDKKILITSDMYLNKEYIEKILKKAKIDKYAYLFLSNDIKLNKHTGKIYGYIVEKLKISSKEIIHIGDSKRGDYIQARLHGIKSILIPKKLNKRNRKEQEDIVNKLDYNILKEYKDNNIDLNNNQYFNIGYKVLGPLLFGYSKWIVREVDKKKINKIFFLAREGSLLKKAVDIVINSNIITKYIYVSRKSVRPALLENVKSLDELKSIVKMKPTTTVKKFLKDLGLDDKEHFEFIKAQGYKEDTKIEEVHNIENLFENLKSDINFMVKNEKNNIIGYLNSNGFCDNIAISDVGWAGSMQKSLNIIFEQYRIAGFYIATTNEKQDIEKYSYLDNYEKIRPFVHLFEDMFLAQHGTTLKYKTENENYEPVLDKYEYSLDEKTIFMQIQNGALTFVKEFNSNEISNIIELNHSTTFVEMEKLGLNPTLKEIQLFENIPYIETIKLHLIERKGLFYYIFHIKKFKEDFYNSGWKIGFLKKVFKIKLPYFKIYKFLLKYKEQNR